MGININWGKVLRVTAPIMLDLIKKKLGKQDESVDLKRDVLLALGDLGHTFAVALFKTERGAVIFQEMEEYMQKVSLELETLAKDIAAGEDGTL